MTRYRRIHTDFNTEKVQQASEDNSREVQSLAIRPFGVIAGPFYEDCEAKIGQCVLVEPQASDINVQLPEIRKDDIGKVITIRYNSDSAYTVNIFPASEEDFVEDGDIVSLKGNEEVCLIVLPENKWAILRLVGQTGRTENGFPDASQVTLYNGSATYTGYSFDDSSRTLTIKPADDTFTFFSGGNEFFKSGTTSVTITDSQGIHYIYFDTDGNLVSTQTWDDAIITTYAYVAFVYWDSTNSKHIRFGYELHGITMTSATHIWAHNTFGALWSFGLTPSNMTVDGDGSSDSHAQIAVEDGRIYDEDIPLSIEDDNPQDLSTIADLPRFYRSGAAGDWFKDDADGFIVSTTGTGRAAWNEYTGSTWQKTEVGNAKYTLSHLIATNDVEEPMIIIMGQNEYTTKAGAYAGAETELTELELGDINEVLKEYVAVATFIIQTATAYSNTVKSRIVSTEDGDDFIDWRTTGVVATGGTGGTTTDGSYASHEEDEPPSSPSSYDDEFNDASLDAKWSWIRRGAPSSWAENKGRIHASVTSTGVGGWRITDHNALVQNGPSGVDFEVYAKVRGWLKDTYHQAGIFTDDGTNTNWIAMLRQYDAAGDGVRHDRIIGGVNNLDNFKKRFLDYSVCFLKIKYIHSTGTFSFYASAEGTEYNLRGTYVTGGGWSPSRVGLYFYDEYSVVANQTFEAAFDWFRVTLL